MTKRIATLIAVSSLLAAVAPGQPGRSSYTITDLGPVGKTPGSPFAVAGSGLVAGGSATADGTAMHAVLWYKGRKLDLGEAGIGRPNSVALGVNNSGQVVGQADTLNTYGAADFCGFHADGFKSATACIPFLWHNGVMQPLPTLGGVNGVANKINNRGQAVGFAETTITDAGCPVSRFEPVVWEYGGVRQLRISVTGSQDTYGLAADINDHGQVVGSSGVCGPFNAAAQGYLVQNHALLWDREGNPRDLGNLGGGGGIAGNHACAVNNRGQVAGHSELKGNAAFHGFRWTEATGMVDLGTLPGDPMSLANGINDAGEVVGASIGAGFATFTAVRWDSGGIMDLNKLVTANPGGLYLLAANWVSSSGEIVGLGVAADGLHGFLATPNGGQALSPAFQDTSRPALAASIRQVVRRQLGIGLP